MLKAERLTQKRLKRKVFPDEYKAFRFWPGRFFLRLTGNKTALNGSIKNANAYNRPVYVTENHGLLRALPIVYCRLCIEFLIRIITY